MQYKNFIQEYKHNLSKITLMIKFYDALPFAIICPR